jgi:hypothetical protein
LDKAEGFCAAPVAGPFPLGTPEEYAAGKANLFPEEGGAAILEIEVPRDIADLASREGGDFRFLPGYGLEELRHAWDTLPKRIVQP